MAKTQKLIISSHLLFHVRLGLVSEIQALQQDIKGWGIYWNRNMNDNK